MDDFKKIIIPLLGVAVFIIFVGFLYNKDKFKLPFSNKAKTTSESSKSIDIKIGKNTIKATLANTNELRKTGLGGVGKLEENGGMLFVFEEKGGTGRYPPVFWMKDMLIAIDILWIDDGKITQIDKNIKPPQKDTPDKDLTKYTPKNPVDYVLEVGGGYSDKNGIKEGDDVEIPNL